MKKRASKKTPKKAAKKAKPVYKQQPETQSQINVDALLGQLASLLKGAGSTDKPSQGKPATMLRPTSVMPMIPRPSPAQIARAEAQLFMPETETGDVPDMSDAHNAAWTNDGSMSDEAAFSDMPHTRENWLGLMGQFNAKCDFLTQKIKALEMMVFEMKSFQQTNKQGARM